MFSKLTALLLLAAAAVHQTSAAPNAKLDARGEKPATAIGYHFPECPAGKNSADICAAQVLYPPAKGSALGPCVPCPNGLSIGFEGAAKWYECSVETFADLDCLAPEPVGVDRNGCSDLPFNSYRIACKR